MKKQLLVAGVLAMLAVIPSCSSSKKAQRAMNQDLVEQALPMSGAQYKSDAEYYRSVQSGVSPERSMAKKIAMQNARQEIAAAVETDVATVMENYAKSQKLPSQQSRSYEERVTELTYSIVKQTVSGMTLMDEKFYKESNGDYRHYVCIYPSRRQASWRSSPSRNFSFSIRLLHVAEYQKNIRSLAKDFSGAIIAVSNLWLAHGGR